MSKEGAQGSVKEWLGRRGFFVQSSVKTGTVDTIKGVYTPAYLYSAMATSQYSAQIGENYQETETYTTTDSNGNTVVRTRTVTKTEWRYLQGQHSQYVMDVLVTGSRAIPNPELEAIEPFDLRLMRKYTPALISGWIAEEPTLSLPECYGLARQEAMEKIGKEMDDFRSQQFSAMVGVELKTLGDVYEFVIAAKQERDDWKANLETWRKQALDTEAAFAEHRKTCNPFITRLHQEADELLTALRGALSCIVLSKSELLFIATAADIEARIAQWCKLAGVEVRRES